MSFSILCVTYKLKLNHGDLKATQGDTGHTQAQMLTEIYAHILDEDRKVNAQKFEAAFYSVSPLALMMTPLPLKLGNPQIIGLGATFCPSGSRMGAALVGNISVNAKLKL